MGPKFKGLLYGCDVIIKEENLRRWIMTFKQKSSGATTSTMSLSANKAKENQLFNDDRNEVVIGCGRNCKCHKEKIIKLKNTFLEAL